MKKATVFTALYLGVMAFCVTPSFAVDRPVNIPDRALHRAIASELGKGVNTPITREEMQALIELDSADAGISDLTGLEFATNLEELDLSNNNISDVSPLRNLVNLVDLYLDSNNISDLLPLKNLVKLEQLRLDSNNISYASPLKDLVNLEQLRLDSNNISYVSPLKDLVELRDLRLDSNNISDVSPLKDLVELRDLRLDSNNISDVSPLKNLVKLKRLRLQGNPVRNAQELSHLNNTEIDIDPELATEGFSDRPVYIPDRPLRRAIASELGKDVFAPITREEMQALIELDSADAGISDLTGLEFATNLEWLDLSNNDISDLSPLKNLVTLVLLSLRRNNISDVSPLKDLVNLEWLDLSENNISDVSPLKDLVNLEQLRLQGNPVRNAQELSHLNNTEIRIDPAPPADVLSDPLDDGMDEDVEGGDEWIDDLDEDMVADESADESVDIDQDVSRFEYRRGPFMSLGAGASRVEFLGESPELPIYPAVSLRLGYGVKERRLYYVSWGVLLDWGLGVGYMSFPENYDKVYTFGGIGTIIFPVPTSDERDQYGSGISLAGTPSVVLHGGIGYQWTRHSTLEVQLSYAWDSRDEPHHLISAGIVLRGFLW